MHKPRTTLVFYMSILTMLLAVGSFVFFFKVIKNKNHHTSAVLTTLQSKINKKENIETLEKKIVEVEATRKVINGYFVDSNHIDSFINYLENLGTNTKTELVVKSVEISSSEANTVLGQVSIKGGFADVMRTTTLLENIPYQIHITSLYLNKDIQTVTTEVKGKTVVTTSSVWQADIAFRILSSL